MGRNIAGGGIQKGKRTGPYNGRAEEEKNLRENSNWRTIRISDKIIVHSRTVQHLDIIKVLLPTDAQENRLKRNIKIHIKTAATCFGVITIIREPTV